MASNSEEKTETNAPPRESTEGLSIAVCPICVEELDPSDRCFFPCPCDYQVCLWCVVCINQKLGGKCPACRQPYNESLYRYIEDGSSVNQSSTAKQPNAKKQSNQPTATTRPVPRTTQKASATVNPATSPLTPSPQESSTVSPNVRVIKKNLVYVIGIPSSKCDKEELMSLQYFGRYGTVCNLALSKTRSNCEGHAAPPSRTSYSAYITYSSEEEARDCIHDVDGAILDKCPLRAYFGTTKYCLRFLRGQKCTKPDCFYLHNVGPKENCAPFSVKRDEAKRFQKKSRGGHEAKVECNEKEENLVNLRPPCVSLYRIQYDAQRHETPRTTDLKCNSSGSSIPTRTIPKKNFFGLLVTKYHLEMLQQKKNIYLANTHKPKLPAFAGKCAEEEDENKSITTKEKKDFHDPAAFESTSINLSDSFEQDNAVSGEQRESCAYSTPLDPVDHIDSDTFVHNEAQQGMETAHNMFYDTPCGKYVDSFNIRNPSLISSSYGDGDHTDTASRYFSQNASYFPEVNNDNLYNRTSTLTDNYPLNPMYRLMPDKFHSMSTDTHSSTQEYPHTSRLSSVLEQSMDSYYNAAYGYTAPKGSEDSFFLKPPGLHGIDSYVFDCPPPPPPPPVRTNSVFFHPHPLPSGVPDSLYLSSNNLNELNALRSVLPNASIKLSNQDMSCKVLPRQNVPLNYVQWEPSETPASTTHSASYCENSLHMLHRTQPYTQHFPYDQYNEPFRVTNPSYRGKRC